MDDDPDDGPGSGGYSGGNSTEMGYASANDTRPIYAGYTPYGPPHQGGATSPTQQYYNQQPQGQNYNTSPPGSVNNHAPPPTNNYGPPPNNGGYGAPPNGGGYGAPPNGGGGLGAPPNGGGYGAPPGAGGNYAPPPPNAYGAPGGPNLPPTTPLLAGAATAYSPPSSPPNTYANAGLPRGYEYDYSSHVPPSAADGAGFGGATSPTSPTFSKRSSLPPPPPGAASPNYGALAAAAGLGAAAAAGGASVPAPSATPAPAHPGLRSRRTSNGSFATTGSQYSVDQIPAVIAPQSTGLPAYTEQPIPMSHSRTGLSAGSSGQSHGPATPGFDAYGDEGNLVRSPSGNSGWLAAGRPETPLVDQRLDPDSILSAKGRSPGGKRLSMGPSMGSEDSLGSGSLRDHEDYSRRVLQVTNPS